MPAVAPVPVVDRPCALPPGEPWRSYHYQSTMRDCAAVSELDAPRVVMATGGLSLSSDDVKRRSERRSTERSTKNRKLQEANSKTD